MKMRQKLNKRVDHKVFRKTAARTHKMNIPGQVVSRGGIRL